MDPVKEIVKVLVVEVISTPASGTPQLLGCAVFCQVHEQHYSSVHKQLTRKGLPPMGTHPGKIEKGESLDQGWWAWLAP